MQGAKGGRRYLYDALLDSQRLADPDYWEVGDQIWDGYAGNKRTLAKYVNEMAEAFDLPARITNVRERDTAYAVLNNALERIRESPSVLDRLPGFTRYADQANREEVEQQYEEYMAAKTPRQRKLKTRSATIGSKAAIMARPIARSAVGFTPYLPPQVSVPMMGVDKGMSASSSLLASTLQALQTDFFVLKGQITRGTKKKPLPPIAWEFHGNVLGGAITLVAIGGFLYMVDLRIGPYAATMSYGHWEWRRSTYGSPGTKPSDTTIMGKSVEWPGNTYPTNTETHTFPEIGHWGPIPGYGTEIDYESGKIRGWIPGYVPPGDRPWVVDQPAETVTATLVIDKTVEEKRFGIHERYHKSDQEKAQEIVNFVKEATLLYQISRVFKNLL